MNRREKLLLGILGKEPDLQKTRMLDATIWNEICFSLR